jgi:hypothetical protein
VITLREGAANPNWKGGHRYWSKGRWGLDKDGLSWKTQQRLAQERGGGKCEDCGKTDQENGRKCDTDHVIPWRISFSHHLDNLRIRCRSCHHKEEAKRPEVWGGKCLGGSRPRKPRCVLCNGKKRKVKLDGKCLTCLRDELLPLLIQLKEEGRTNEAIGKIVGLAGQTVSYYLCHKKLGPDKLPVVHS